MLEKALREVPGVDSTVVDQIVAMGMVNVLDVEEVGADPLVNEIQLDRELAARIVVRCSEEARKVAEQQGKEKRLFSVAQEKEKAEKKQAELDKPAEPENPGEQDKPAEPETQAEPVQAESQPAPPESAPTQTPPPAASEAPTQGEAPAAPEQESTT